MNFLKTIKDWSGWDRAGVLGKSRWEAFLAILTAGTAALVSFDWMPHLLGEVVNWKALGFAAGYVALSAIVTDFIRRKGTKTVEGHMVPEVVVVDRKKTAKAKEETK